MKRLLFAPLLLILLLASCSTNKKYNSYREANDACNDWAKEKGNYKKYYPQSKELEEITDEEFLKLFPEIRDRQNNRKFYPSTTIKFKVRYCELENKTKQVLGMEVINRKENQVITFERPCTNDFACRLDKEREDRVKRNFYF